MKSSAESDIATATQEETGGDGDLVRALMDARTARMSQPSSFTGVIFGEIVGITHGGDTPLVVYPEQPGSAALPARTIVELHDQHVGRQALLAFDGGDPARPVIIGLLREGAGWPLAERPRGVEVEADGQRLLVSAKEQIVLRCGEASITLTKAGKVLIQGTFVQSRSSGVNRIKGGSVQIN